MKTTEPTVRDPICGMDIDPASAAATSERDGELFSFCSIHCRDPFPAERPEPRAQPGPAGGGSGDHSTGEIAEAAAKQAGEEILLPDVRGCGERRAWSLSEMRDEPGVESILRRDDPADRFQP